MNGLLTNQPAYSQGSEDKLPGYLGREGFTAGEELTPVDLETCKALLIASSKRMWKASAEQVKGLSTALDHLPLALYTAGRVLDERWYWSIDAYRKKIAESEAKLQAAETETGNAATPPKERRVVAALMLAYRLLEGRSKPAALARAVFMNAGYCQPDRPIPAELFNAANGAGKAQQAELDHALLRLYDLGLLRPSESGPVILECAAGLARRLDSPAKNGLKRIVDACLRICEAEKDKPEQGALLMKIAPHIEMAAQHVKEDGKTNPARIWNRLGHAFWAHFDLQRAQYCFEQSLTEDERILGPAHVEVGADCSLLGRVLHELGELKTAKHYYQRSIAVTEKAISRDYPGIAEEAARLGRLLHECGEMEEALAMFERALAIHEKSYDYGPRHPSTAGDLHLLGSVQYDMKSWDKARESFERALEIHEWNYGSNHHTVHADLTQLGKTLRNAGEYELAKACFERVLRIERKIAENPEYNDPSTLNNLGLTLQDMGNPVAARAYFEQAMRIDESTLGPDHPNVARDANNLGCVLRDMGDLPGARKYFEQAVTVNEAARGPDHRDVATSACNLGRVLYELGDLEDARKQFERVLKIDEKIYGLDHLETANDCAHLGIVLQDMGDLQLARKYYERAMGVFQAELPADNPKRINVENALEKLKGHP